MPHITETIAVLNQRLSRKEITREALVAEALTGAQSKPAQYVFTKTYGDAALAAARYADASQAAGVAMHPIAGLPVSVKDLYDVAGETTMAGSTVCEGEPAAKADCPAVARLRSAGSAIVGKTNMTEFAFSGVGINPHYGTPVNPTDNQVARIPGGSSSGAAVSVALGLSVAGLGSDTGGSIRVPAALNGLVGFKNTQKRTPLQGALELSHSLDTVCAMTRSVEDCWLVDGILAGEALKVVRRPLTAMRFAVPQTLVLDAMAPEVAQAFNRTLSALSKAGAQIIDIPLREFAELSKINSPVGFAPIESYAVHYERLMRAEHKFDPLVAKRVKLGESVTAKQYLDLINRRADWIERTEAVIQGFDAVLCPTAPILAPEIAALAASEEAFFKANGLLLRNTSVFNFLDGCSFSLPCHDAGELPVGLMVSSVRGDDARLVAVALAIEACLQMA
eukprot:gene11356-11445_t